MLSIPRNSLSTEFYDGCTTIIYRTVRETDSFSVGVKLLKNLHRKLFIIETVGKGIGFGLAIARQIIVEK